ncbi:TRAP transporter large permease [Bradyrhizobium sp. 200]|uniref:TRAP transporter large permease n=1 Tax=Bradyrhizobium sp. 200 TaxID=2782665 RepID=UPI001FFEB950|nr:TRAP transporter large permease [Bradyrhizobium sp. 200]UPJ48417.1 TRAP transporter large permease [Bradyrhizobium sp. 200]
MTTFILFTVFIALMAFGVPIGVALGAAGTVVIMLTSDGMEWFGLFAVQQSFDAGIGKYPLLALPMFVLVGCAFDRSGIATRIIDFASALLGRGPGILPLVCIVVAMLLGGISGSGAALAAAIGSVMLGSMTRVGYPPAFSATVVGAATATDILIPPSLAFVVYSILVPAAGLNDLFIAGLIPGVLAGVALIAPAWWLSRRHGFGSRETHLPRPPFWKSLREASWGLATPILILGGMRAGMFTPTEAAVVAATYILFVGLFIHRTIEFRDLPEILAESATVSACILVIFGLSGAFQYCVSTLGIAEPIVQWFGDMRLGSIGTLVLVLVVLKLLGMVMEGTTIFLVFVPLLSPLGRTFGWDPVWFGVLVTMVIALGQFTPPLAINLMISCRLAKVPIEATLPWVGWFMLSFAVAIAAVITWPQLALWLPRALAR